MTDTPNTDPDRTETANKVIAALRQGYEDADWRGMDLNEGDTRSLLICPVLKALGYEARYRKSENSGLGNRPDECLFINPVTTEMMQVAVFVEVKPLGSNFDAAIAPGRADSPTRQIQRYLIQHPASDLNSIGILTDGFRYRIYQRVSETDNRLVADLNLRRIGHMHSRFLEDESDDSVRDIFRLVDLVSRESLERAKRVVQEPIRSTLAAEFMRRMLMDRRPTKVLEALTDSTDLVTSRDLTENVNLQGRALDLHDRDWQSYAYTVIPESDASTEHETTDGSAKPISTTVAAVRFTHGELSRSDMALTARTFAKASPDNAALIIAYVAAWRDTELEVEARIAAVAGGKVNMTAAFDPAIPLPSAFAATDRLIPLIRNAHEACITANSLLEPLAVANLRHTFYALVADWVDRQQQGRDLPYRQAVLQHLIRVMFTWILKEAGQIPVQLFEEAFTIDATSEPDRYHSDVLGFLFHERLSVPREQRVAHSIDDVNFAAEDTPYLNGSLFSRNQDLDGLLELTADDYWGSDPKRLGIFTILSRYHWTLDEHRPGVSEQTLDPELLSNLFERLIAPTDVGPENLDRMPGGTYYTPADVAEEMVKDALTAATRDYAPANMSDDQLRSLYDEDAPAIEIDDAEAKARLAERVATLTIFDPAVGSGEFLFSALVAIKSALGKLNGHAKTEEVVKNQLCGQDIHPLAVQIARLRLFVAIRAGRPVHQPRKFVSSEPDEPIDYPLPNLEARIVCADSLATVADTQWRPDYPEQFDSADPKVRAALIELACNREDWFYAHSEAEKAAVMEIDRKNRKALKKLLDSKGGLASPELCSFAHAEVIANSLVPAETDARLLFYASDWKGFDIVIGNPPYEAPYQHLNAPDTRDQHRDAITKLAEEKRYRTTNIRDMFSLFCEVGLALANPKGGVLTMIVPLSIAFGRREKSLRERVSQSAATIQLRHYAVRPDAIFNESPTVRSPGNSQRATIMTATLGSTPPAIHTTGLNRWPTNERGECLQARNGTDITDLLNGNGGKRVFGQWPRIPTAAVGEMVDAILNQSTPALGNGRNGGPGIGLPMSCGYYLSALPAGVFDTRRENVINLTSRRELLLAMAALNSHVGYAWWLIFGDGFDVKKSDFDGFALPDPWIENHQEPQLLGNELIDAVDECTVTNRFQGKEWKNVDFHSGRPDLIEKIDRLYIEALGLPVEPLLTHLRIMRSNSSWNFPE